MVFALVLHREIVWIPAAKGLIQQHVPVQIFAQPEDCRLKNGRATGKPCTERNVGQSMRSEQEMDPHSQNTSTAGPRGTTLPMSWPLVYCTYLIKMCQCPVSGRYQCNVGGVLPSKDVATPT